MNVEERYVGDAPTPEVRALVWTVFERTLEGVVTREDRVVVRVTSDGDGVACSAQLHPIEGTLVVSAETRPSMFDAVFASASGLERREAGRRIKLRASRR